MQEGFDTGGVIPGCELTKTQNTGGFFLFVLFLGVAVFLQMDVGIETGIHFMPGLKGTTSSPTMLPASFFNIHKPNYTNPSHTSLRKYRVKEKCA